jgi:hypothetical protein
MLLASLLLALQPGAPAPDPNLACAPRVNMTAAGRPPAVLDAQRMEIAPESRVYLSVHRCGEDGYRVERQLTGPGGADRGDLEWVSAAQCPAIAGWIAAAMRLDLPAPMLRPHADPPRPIRGTWFTLNARDIAGAGSVMSLELQILEPPGAAPNALSRWFREGEQVFKTCRDQGHGGTGYAPRTGRLG